MTRLCVAAALVLVVVVPAGAQPPDQPQQPGDGVGEPPDPTQPLPPPPPPEPKPPAEDTSASVANAARPDQVSGTLEPLHDGPSPLRRVGQVLLFVPRWATWVAFSPIRGGLWAFNRFQLGDQFKSIFFNDEGTVGVFPVAFVETGFGLNIGARFIIRDMLAPKSKIQARVSYGGQFRQLYSAKATTGEAFGKHLELQLEGAFTIFPRSRFFGIGNNEEFSDPPAMPIDPLTDDTAVRTRFRHDDYRVKLGMSYRMWRDFSVKASLGYRNRDFDTDAEVGGDVDIFSAYDQMRLVGYDQGLSNLYPEVELVWDSRRPISPYVSAANAGTGSKVAGFLGYASGAGDDPSAYWRYGVDVAHHIDVYQGDRYLILRGYFEGVSGGISEVPFIDLPRLGGPTALRGYDRDRFRDRIATFGTIEYNYPVLSIFSSYLFVDAGRVYRRRSEIDFDSLEDFHVGFGGGIQIQSLKTFIARISLFTSIDGGLFFTFSADPVFDSRAKEETP